MYCIADHPSSEASSPVHHHNRHLPRADSSSSNSTSSYGNLVDLSLSRGDIAGSMRGGGETDRRIASGGGFSLTVFIVVFSSFCIKYVVADNTIPTSSSSSSSSTKTNSTTTLFEPHICDVDWSSIDMLSSGLDVNVMRYRFERLMMLDVCKSNAGRLLMDVFDMTAWNTVPSYSNFTYQVHFVGVSMSVLCDYSEF